MLRYKSKRRGHNYSDSIKSPGLGLYLLKQCLTVKDNNGTTFNSTVPPSHRQDRPLGAAWKGRALLAAGFS